MKALQSTVSVLFIYFGILEVKSSETKVFGISPQSGSRNGGTRITIKGQHFSKSYFNFGPGNENLGSKVWLSALTSYECEIHPDGSHHSQITCYTVPMPLGSYSVKISVDGVDVSENNYCINVASCQFTVKDANTPTITSIQPSSGLPGAFIEITGKLLTTRYAANEPEETLSVILRVYFGGQKCELRNFLNDTMYGIWMGSDGIGAMKCKTEGTYIGNHNISFMISNNGRSLPSPSLKYIHRKGIAMFQTFTEITGLSVNQGSLAGGTKLLIKGRYFDETDAPVKVFVGEKLCIVERPISDTEIICLTPNESKASYYSGNRGWYVYIQEGEVDPIKVNRETARVEHIDSSHWSGIMSRPHAIHMVGYFVPEYTGHYSFCLRSAGKANLYLSMGSDPEHKSLLPVSCAISNSNTINLEAYEKYYMEVHYGATVQKSFITIISKLLESPYTKEMTDYADHEVQKITFNSVSLEEIQTLHISTEGVNGEIVPDVQVITISGNDEEIYFALGLNGAFTVPFKFTDIQSSTVENEIKLLPSVSFPVQVAAAISPGQVTLTITSTSPEGDISFYNVIEMGNSNKLKFSAKKINKGTPNLATYTLEMDGIKTLPIDKKADKIRIKKEIERLLEVHCHPLLTKVSLIDNFEYKSSHTVIEEEPFCGRYSARNVLELFNRNILDGFAISLTGNKYLCFAYKGLGLMEHVTVVFGYRRIDLQWLTGSANFKVTNETPDKWNFWCENLVDLFKTVALQGSAVTVVGLKFLRQINSLDIYIDQVFLSTYSILERVQGNFNLLRMPHFKLSGFISEVSVDGEFPLYQIVLKSHRCGHGFPLLRVASASFSGTEYLIQNMGSITIKIQSVQKSSPPIGGTFNVIFKKDNSGPVKIPDSVKSDNLYNALSTMSIGISKVEAWGTCSSFSYIVTMLSLPGNQPLIEIDSSEVTGNKVKVQVLMIKDGGLRLEPIMGDFLHSYHSTPQVVAFINNVPTRCHRMSSCEFQWTSDLTPEISDLSPDSGSVGTVLQIKGTGFSPLNSDNEVFIGNTTCTVIKSNKTQLTCSVGSGGSTNARVKVLVNGKGFARETPLFTYASTITSFEPKRGSLGGGTLVKITGNGFTEENEVKFDNLKCVFKNVSASQIMCRTPTPISSPGKSHSVEVVFKQHNNTDSMGTFVYDPDVTYTPVVKSLSTHQTTTWGQETITITGLGFGNTIMPVMVGNTSASVVSYTDTTIVFILPTLPEGSYQLIIDVLQKGYADLRTNKIPEIVYTFNVLSMSPDFGSLFGGTDLVITGNGFSLNSSYMSVTVGPHQCDITYISDATIKCRIGDTGKYHTVSATGLHAVLGYGYAWDKDPITVNIGDYIKWTWQTPQYVSDIAYGVKQTATSYDLETFPNGFDSGLNSRKGSFTHHFTAVGTYYYWTGYLDSKETIYFRGKVIVVDLQSYSAELSVKALGIKAKHITSTNLPKQKNREACPDYTSDIPSCQENPKFEVSSSTFHFKFLKCFSPFFISLSKNEGIISDEISITGEGFGNELCQNEIFYENSFCTIKSAKSSILEFSMNSFNKPRAGDSHPFQVRVKNLGYALLTNSHQMNRYKLLPSISMVSPSQGSKVGGTRMTITGSGFTGSAETISVYFDFLMCDVGKVTYTSIECVTKCDMSCYAGMQKIHAFVQAKSAYVEAHCTGDNCTFFTTEAYTPTISSVVPENVSQEATTLEILGAGLTLSSDVRIFISDKSCFIKKPDKEKDEITCTIGRLPVGPNEIKVYVGNYGLAFTTMTIYSSPIAAIKSPEQSGLYGGALLLIEGNGFTQQTTVTVDTLDCPIVNISLSQIECILPAHDEGPVNVYIVSNNVHYGVLSLTYSMASTPRVISVNPHEGINNIEITISGSGFTSLAAVTAPVVKIGWEACTNVKVVSDTSITCTTGPLNTGLFSTQVFVEQKGFSNSDVKFTYQIGSFTISPQKGSTNGGQLVTLSGSGFLQGKTTVTICGAACSEVSVTTSQYVCKTFPLNDHPSLCDVLAIVNGASRTLPASYNYDSSIKSTVTSVKPSRGGTAGGTLLTITGSDFGAEKKKVDVLISGVRCQVQSVKNEEIQCITGPSTSNIADVEVTINNQGLSKVISGQFEYIDLWSSPNTWGGDPPPVDGDFIVIPANQKILLDTNTSLLKMLLIQGGQLFFDEANVELKAENILVNDGGLLQIGSPMKPFPSQYKAIITLYGNLRSKEVPIYGAKTLAVRNGTLNLFGTPVNTVWTRLSKTAEAGSKILTLETKVDWKQGDEIVVATTGERHSQAETETGIIESVNGNIVTLTEALKFKHLGTSGHFGQQTVNFRAEVGLLTRNIVVRGNKDASFETKISACPVGFNTGEFAVQTCFQGRFGEELGSSQFGSQIMVHQLGKDHQMSQAHIEYVEITFAGQAFRLGRYPVHFHLNGNMDKSFVRGCAIHNSFNRAVNIHGSHNALVEKNILYSIMGGAFFLEDGDEVGNIFQYNLAVYVRSSTSLRNDDITPAGFWVTNANNTLRHNAVAGGTHFGYWYRMHKHPDGPGFNTNICPQAALLTEFSNNSAHSLGWFGLWIFETYVPKQYGSCWSGAAHQVAKFSSLTAWNCHKGAEAVFFGAVQFHQFILVNNMLAGFEGKGIVGNPPEYDVANGPGLFNSIIVSHHDNVFRTGTVAGVVIPQYPGFLIQDVKFYNFDVSGHSSLAWTLIDGVCSLLCTGYLVKTKSLEFINSPNKVQFKWDSQGILFDEDGSLTGVKQSSVVACSPSYDTSKCRKKLDFSGSHDGCVCTNVRFYRFSFYRLNPSSLNGKNALFESNFGVTSSPYVVKRVIHKPGWAVNLMANTFYKFTFENAAELTNFSFDGAIYNLEPGDFAAFTLSVNEQPDKFQLYGSKDLNMSSEMLTKNNVQHGHWFYNNSSKALTFAVKKQTSHPVLSLRVIRCYYVQCKVATPTLDLYEPQETGLWSDPRTWVNITKDGLEPRASSDLIIPKNKRIQVDKRIPSLGKVVIEGVLQFLEGENMDFLLDVECIYIIGRLIAGKDNASPLKGKLVIRLRSSIINDIHPVKGGPSLNSKFIAVYGGLQLHGKDRGIIKTSLTSTVDSGNKITVTDAVPWTTGDIILITTTDYNPWHTETFTITSITEKTIIVNDTIKHRHIAHDEKVERKHINLRSIVALLSRNIRIESKEEENLLQSSEGARVIVAQASYKEEQYSGFAQLSNVEFYHTGQEGFRESNDPRFSVAFVDVLNSVEGFRYSYVKKSTFYCGFNTAIGAFAISNLVIDDNIVHHTVGAGIRTESTSTEITNNLVTLSIWPGTYQGRNEKKNPSFEGAIEAIHAESLVLVNNTVAGSERIGYHLRGQMCNIENNLLWNVNTAIGTLLGIATVPIDTMVDSNCVMFHGFLLWKNFDFGIYYNNFPSLIFKNNILIENGVGIFTFILGPNSVNHEYSNKFLQINDNILIGKTSTFSDRLDNLDSTYLDFSDQIRSHKSEKPCGKIGIEITTFVVGSNDAPIKKLTDVKTYPAIKGETTISNNIFTNFKSCSGGKDILIVTNKRSADACHPVLLQGSTLIDVQNECKLFFHPPDVNKVNPADCVDMDCDGLKKCIIEDLDGTFLGHIGTVLPNSAYEWDGDPRHGLGDYRIPKSMLINENGSLTDAKIIAPKKGIYKTDHCLWVTDWNSFNCKNIYNWRLLTLESMDSDTETRRLSPIAIYNKEGYVDLLNGPQDHGWCSGYTCQRRLSLFQAIIALEKNFHIYLTSTPPKEMRYMLLIAGLKECVGLAFPHMNQNRMEVRVNGTYILPTNGYIDSKGNFRLKLDDNFNFMPDVGKKVTGENYFRLKENMFYLTVCGNSEITATQANVLIVSLVLPAVKEEDFFNEDIVKNLAAFLNVHPSKVRIVSIVRNTPMVKSKRATESVTYNVEIADSPMEKQTINFDYLSSRIAIQAQLGNLSKELQLPIMSISLVQPGDDSGKVIKLQYAKGLVLATEPFGDVIEGQTLRVQPQLNIVGDNGDILDNVGFPSMKWVVEATIENQNLDKSLLLFNTAAFEGPIASFTDLTILKKGTYSLKFQIINPPEASHMHVVSKNIEIQAFRVDPEILVLTSTPLINEPITLNIALYDNKTKQISKVMKSYMWSWSFTIKLYLTFVYFGKLDGTFKNLIDNYTGEATVNITLDKAGLCPLLISIHSDPPDWSVQKKVFIPVMTQYQAELFVEEIYFIELSFNLTYEEINAFYWSVYIRNYYSNLDSVRVINAEYRKGSFIVVLKVEVDRIGLKTLMKRICQQAINKTSFDFNGKMATLSNNVKVNGSLYLDTPCYSHEHEASKGSQSSRHHLVLSIVIISIFIVIALILLWLPLLNLVKSFTKISGQSEINSPSQLASDVAIEPLSMELVTTLGFCTSPAEGTATSEETQPAVNVNDMDSTSDQNLTLRTPRSTLIL